MRISQRAHIPRVGKCNIRLGRKTSWDIASQPHFGVGSRSGRDGAKIRDESESVMSHGHDRFGQGRFNPKRACSQTLGA